MRITTGVAWVLLIAAVAGAQDDGIAGVARAQDDSAIAEQIEAAKKHVSIGSVEDKVTANKKTGEKTQVIKVISEQDPDDPFVGTVRLTVEAEADDKIWYGQQQQTQKKQLSTRPGAEKGKFDYEGEDVWSFKIALSTELKDMKVKAYAAEYGFVVSNKVVSNKFVGVTGKYDGAESADEITARNQGSKNILKIKSTGKALKQGEGDEEKKSGGDSGSGGGGGD
jgi:hypothetical protein